MERAAVLVEWPQPDGLLRAYEPTPAALAAVAPRLAAFYNDPHNLQMMAHGGEMSVAEVREHYARLRAEGGRPLLLERDGVLVGDADLRRLEPDRAETAILIGDRANQGRGLGLRFGLMVHALAFRHLRLARLYVSIIPTNAASLRLFRRLGYGDDDSPQARTYADEAADVTLSLAAADFEALHGAALAGIRFGGRGRATSSSGA